jgi:hypothetical protein
MSDDEDTLASKCIKSLINDFKTYDQAVDVVSCLESVFKFGYKNWLSYFDRFPYISSRDLTPDASVLFDEKYGLIFEVKRTFPKDDVGFKKEVEQLLSYDKKLEFKCDSSGRTLIPETHDIVLIISATQSNQIFNRLNKLIDEDQDFRFENNLIFMEYFYNTSDTEARYVFRKYMGKNRKFRDEFLPEKERLEYILGECSKSLECYPRHFMQYKVSQVLCNDKPPELYMAVFLWTKIFYSYLSEEQKKDWSRGNHKRIQNISINYNELCSNLNSNYIIDGNIRRGWIVDAICFLEAANLAKREPDDQAYIHYRNLNKIIGNRHHISEDVAEKEEFSEYGHLIAIEFCINKNKIKKIRRKTKPMTKKLKQTTLFEDGEQ